jgi:hypothetical protein
VNLKEKKLSISKLYYPKVFKQNNKNFSDENFFAFATGVVDNGDAP